MTLEMFIKYPVVMLIGLCTTLLATPVWESVAARWGLMDHPGDGKPHATPTPTAGGVPLFLGLHAVFAAVFLLPWNPFGGQIDISWWFRFLPLSGLVLALGLRDDVAPLSPASKFTGQLLIALLAWTLGLRIEIFLGLPLPVWADLSLSLLWFLVFMNSFNLIDGLDGLATGIATIAAAGIGISLIFRQQPGDVLLILGFAAACLGFLRSNFAPARVFLGDAGSLLIGFTLASLALSTSSKGAAVAGVGMSLLAIGVPLFDTLLAVWRRSIRRFEPAADPALASSVLGIDQRDEEHLHHRLLGRVQDQGRVALYLYAFTAVLTGAGILANIFHDRALGILALTVLFAGYTVLRHLAWIELRDSGRLVLKGIARPIRRNRVLVCYIVFDLLILHAALLGALLLLDLQDGLHDVALKAAWLDHAPRDIVLPFLLLLVRHAHTRVWYLARVSEYLEVGLTVLFGVALALAVHLLTATTPADIGSGILYYVLFLGLAAPLIVGIRAAPRLARDAAGRLSSEGGMERSRVLLCGAGHRTDLFLRQQADVRGEETPVLEVVGVLDPDPAIRGHFVHGIRVLGKPSDLPVLVEKYRIQAVYVLEELPPETFNEVWEVLQTRGIRLLRWELKETTVLHGASESATDENPSTSTPTAAATPAPENRHRPESAGGAGYRLPIPNES